MRKRKIWISCSVLTDNYLSVVEGVNPNSKEYKMTFDLSRFVQIKRIKENVENLICNHPIELEGFYISSGAKYYIALRCERKCEAHIDQLPSDFKILRNAPHTSYKRINLKDEYESLKLKVEKYRKEGTQKTGL